jgi:LAO/AO transport system kinase
MADAIAVTKADGDNLVASERLQLELSQVLHLLAPATVGWKPEVLTCSAVKGSGIPEVWAVVEKFRKEMTASGEWDARRLRQVQEGLVEFAREQVLAGMLESAVVQHDLNAFGGMVAEGKMTLREAAGKVAADFLASKR